MERKRSSMTSATARLQEAALRVFAERGDTQMTVSELAQVAGVARGTVYNNLSSPDGLFEQIAANLADEMHGRVVASFAGVDDPAQRLANGARMFIRRAHEEPHWGLFIIRFAFTNKSLQGMLAGPPAIDLMTGLERGRYRFRPAQLPSVLALVAGAVLSAMLLVNEGHKTWREAGAEMAELILRALGLDDEEARIIAASELPPLPRLT